MNRVNHFEIYTPDPETVQPFYGEVFGWKFQKFEGGPMEYWLVTTGDDRSRGSTVESRVRGKGRVQAR